MQKDYAYGSMNEHAALQRSRMLLKYAFGATLLLIGLDKVFGLNLIAGWEGYVSELALSVLPVTAGTVVLGLGIIEIVVGILMITQWTRLAAVLSIGALALIVVNLLSLGLYDIAARDVLLALALLVLVWLTDAVPQERKWL
jgi:hypothetical protein